MNKIIRAFIAIHFPETVKEDLYSSIIEFKWKGFKRVEKNNIHLTLKFLGSLPESKVEKVVEKLKKAAYGTQRFSIEIVNFGAFPSTKRARVVWAGARETPNQLKELFEKIDRLLAELNFKKESRDFLPHITLGRFKIPLNITSEATKIGEKIANTKPKVEIDKFYLVKSTLFPSGPKYENIAEFNLG